MKRILLYLVMFSALVLLSGCASAGNRSSYSNRQTASYTFNNIWTAQVGQSQLGPAPIPNGSESFRSLTGDVNYSRRRGTEEQVTQRWNPYTGELKPEFYRRTYDDVNYSRRQVYLPAPRIINDPCGPKSGHWSGQVPLIPQLPR